MKRKKVKARRRHYVPKARRDVVDNVVDKVLVDRFFYQKRQMEALELTHDIATATAIFFAACNAAGDLLRERHGYTDEQIEEFAHEMVAGAIVHLQSQEQNEVLPYVLGANDG